MEVRSLQDIVPEALLEFVNDSTARDANEFRVKVNESYPYVSDVPVRELLMFPSTYLYEQSFSAMFCMKTKLCAGICVKTDLRVALSKTVPRIE